MDVAAFSHHFPTLYHLTFATNLPGIREHGLHSPQSLANLHVFSPEERDAALTSRRRCMQNLHGVMLRDQNAAPEARMKSCLVKISIPEWLSLLNSKTFFFLSADRAARFADSYTGYENLLLEVDTGTLLAAYAARTTLCKINSGSFLYHPRPRGRSSFIPLADYEYKNKRDTPAELTVDVPIPHVLDFATLRPLSSSAGSASTQPEMRGSSSNTGDER